MEGGAVPDGPAKIAFPVPPRKRRPGLKSIGMVIGCVDSSSDVTNLVSKKVIEGDFPDGYSSKSEKTEKNRM